MKEKLDQLKQLLLEIADLHAANAVLNWDQSTYMPGGGAAARARQQSTLGRLAHEKSTSPAIGNLLDELQPYADSLPYDSDDASLIRVATRDFERSTKIPAPVMARFYAHSAECYELWSKARPANDFGLVSDALETTLELSREIANYFPGYDHIADPLIDFADYGMKASSVGAVFEELREQLVPMVQAITEQEPADDSCMHLNYPLKQQEGFFTKVIKDFGFSFENGRCDISPHPFTTSFSVGDVRITVRYKETDLSEALFSGLHEAGHGMYEQGSNMAYDGLPLAGGTSSGVHESQSRLWENLVGRSLGFWEHYYPALQATFPAQLGSVSLDTFYRAVNKVQRSLIRTDADEVTYNLHVMLRFGLELELLEGTLAVKDLPDAWNARFKRDIGIEPPNNTDGVLQDIHWYAGTIGGAFQGYTLGNILSAQFFDKAVQAHPEIPGQIKQGQFATLHTWLTDNIYVLGSKYTAPELIERVTGTTLQVSPYIAYLRNKYAELYQL